MLLAFHGDENVKAHYLARVQAHEVADEIIHGRYWEGGRGCAVGCTVHSDSHMAFERELGIPIMLARLEDRLFEGQTNGRAKTFPRRFLECITPGADLSRVGWQFLHWLLTEELVGREDPRVAKAIKRCADVLVSLTKGEPVDRAEARAARDEACQARQGIYAAAYAAYAADAADADAADAAADAADAAAYAADAAADAAAAAAAAAYAAARSRARSEAFGRMADKLIELMRDAPIPERAAVAA